MSVPEPACPCDLFLHPREIVNPPARDDILYRLGEYATFRRALLMARDGEQELKAWRPGASGDLAVQMVEWWAYLADILTFYNERVANESYLRTAGLPESVRRLIRVLGYRPRPGIGASGQVAALINGRLPVALPAGFAIESKPGPGEQPQVFETNAEVVLGAPDAVPAQVPPNPLLLTGGNRVLLRGKVTTLAPGAEVLLLRKGWTGLASGYGIAAVTAIAPEKDASGTENTAVTLSFLKPLPQPSSALASDYRLLVSDQTARTWPYEQDHVVTGTTTGHIHLDTLVRQVQVGDPILLELRTASVSRKLIRVTQYTEMVWDANPGGDPAIPIPHTRLYFASPFTLYELSTWDANRSTIQVRHSWRDAGELIRRPAVGSGVLPLTLGTAGPLLFRVGTALSVLLEDADGRGAAGAATSVSGGTLQLAFPTGSLPELTPPLRALYNLLPVTRGKTVPREVLGSGDAAAAGQEFVLKKSPLTYLLSPGSSSGESYASTLRVWVNDIEWKEAPSFYGQGPEARVFVTREDEEGKTHVLFGDGVFGARLPSGRDNVAARYRYGSGAVAPPAGALTTILQPRPNLRAIRNPVPVGGGADPDPPEQIRRYAPRSVLTFGRAVSGDDYETLAAQTPGVARARAYWAWDADQERTVVKVYVGDDTSAVTAARAALAGASDPNRPLLVYPATAVPVRLSLALRLQAGSLPEPVVKAARAALVDVDRGLFGLQAVRIGQAVYRSQLFEAVLNVPRVLAVHALEFWIGTGTSAVLQTGHRFSPGEGAFFRLLPSDLAVSPEVDPYG